MANLIENDLSSGIKVIRKKTLLQLFAVVWHHMGCVLPSKHFLGSLVAMGQHMAIHLLAGGGTCIWADDQSKGMHFPVGRIQAGSFSCSVCTASVPPASLPW